MSRAINSLQMTMFRTQLELTKEEITSLRAISDFIVTLYVPYWFTAGEAIKAPNTDWQFFKDLVMYAKHNKTLSDAAVKKFSGHLWYLTEELCGLALFDEKVDVKTKEKMAKKIKAKISNPTSQVRRLILKSEDPKTWVSKDLSDFVTPNTVKLFENFGLRNSFLSHKPETWHSKKDFEAAKNFFSLLHVTNDTAERGVALTQEYMGRVRSEEYFQNLLLVAQATRKETTSCTKEALSKFSV